MTTPPPPEAEPSWEQTLWGEPVMLPDLEWTGPPADPVRARSAGMRVEPAATQATALRSRPGPADPAGPLPAASLPAAGRRRVRTVERFRGKRIRHRVGSWRRVRSLFYLLVVGALLAAVLAGVLGAIIAGLSVAIHHVSHN